MSVTVYSKDQLDPQFTVIQQNFTKQQGQIASAASDAAAAKSSAASSVQAIKVNGQTISAANGVADLGTIAASSGGTAPTTDADGNILLASVISSTVSTDANQNIVFS